MKVVGVAGIEPTMAESKTLTPILITPVGFEPTNVRVKAASVFHFTTGYYVIIHICDVFLKHSACNAHKTP